MTSQGLWYTALCPVYIDVVGDFAGTELAVLDGDTLLAMVLRSLNAIDCPSILHGVYLVEEALRKLLDSKASFEIVFVLDRKSTGAQAPDIRGHEKAVWRLFFRSAVIAHLQHTSRTVTVNLFDSLLDDKWSTYVSMKKPYYILTEDGSGLKTPSASGPVDLSDYLAAARAMWTESMWLHLHQGISVVLISEDMFKDNKIVSFVFHASMSSRDSLAKGRHVKGLCQAIEVMDASVKSVQFTDFVEAPPAAEGANKPASAVAKVLVLLAHTRKPLHLDMAKVFLIHSAMLPSIPLELCAQPLAVPRFGDTAKDALATFMELSYAAALSATRGSADQLIYFVDERFFRAILLEVLDTVSTIGLSAVEGIYGDAPFLKQAENAWNIIHSARGFWNYTSLLQAADASLVSNEFHTLLHPARTLSLLPYKQPFLEKYLPILPANASAESVPFFKAEYIPNYETHHWHVAKPLTQTGEAVCVRGKKPQRIAVRKAKQGQAFFIQKYASSLTGASGRIIRPKTIIVQPKKLSGCFKRASRAPQFDETSAPTAISKEKRASASSSASKPATRSKRDAIIAANTERLVSAEKEAANKRWKILRDKVEQLGTSDLVVAELEHAILLERSVSAKVLVQEQKLFIVMFLLNQWSSFCVSPSNKNDPATPQRKEEGINVLVKLFELCTGILAAPDATKATVEQARRILKMVGLEHSDDKEDTARRKSSNNDRKRDKDSEKTKSDTQTFKVKKSNSKSESSKKADALLEADKDMPLSFKFIYPRGVASQSWLRCPHSLTRFQLLHFGTHMDRTMGSASDPRVDFEPDQWQREVLDTIDREESVFVVAPTSAGKTFIAFYAIEKVLRELDDGVVVYVAPTKALVNQIAAILMMQPDVACQWTPRLKRVIFDEIHSISSLEGGLIWEQNLIFAPCPIVALSATVGNPQEFADWLQGVQAAKGHRLNMITHKHRFSNLRKFVFAPMGRPPKFTGLTSKEGNSSLRHLHPIAALSLGLTRIPDDMHLEPFECLQLFDAMHCERDEHAVLPPALSPEKYFAKLGVIKKADVIRYSEDLKTVLQQWMDLPDSRTSGAFRKVLKRLSSDINISLAKMDDGKPQNGLKYALTHVMALCHNLHRNGKLPAILFNYSRHNVEALTQRIFAELIAAEMRYKNTDAQWLKKVAAWDAWKLTEAARKAAMEKIARGSARGKNCGFWEDEEWDAGWQASFDPDAGLPQFSLTGKSDMSPYEIDKDIDFLRWQGVAPELCGALRRGIGVHHAGMNLRYRQTVERYFRAGHLRVVVATGTLALGINMPASTSVFTEDSVYLTALEYRQAAGRAGRRGFDLLGSVVFFGLPLVKASRLPDLAGHFPLSVTLVLRLHQLLSEEKSRAVGEDMMRSVLLLNKILLGKPAARLEVLHHLRFSIDYLRRFSLLSETGEPINLSGLTQHLYWAEPMNLSFTFLVNSGVLSEVVKSIDSELSLLTCLAHLFGRRWLPTKLNEFREEIIKRSPSKVFMEPLPACVVKVLKQHNDLVFQVMKSYIHHYVATLEIEDVAKLPLSGRSFPRTLAKGDVQSPILQRLAERSLPYRARSPFVALSGLDDTFGSVEDLSRTLRSGVSLQSTVVPLVSDLVDDTIVLDSYVIDFYKHGQFKPLTLANSIWPGDVWQMLNDFRLIIASLRVSLEVLLQAHKNTELVRLKRETEDDEDDHPRYQIYDEDDEEGEVAATSNWRPALVIKPELRDRRLWDIYKVLCRIQRTFNKKLEAMNA
ncbi:hypothetical protein PhCBS80983_g05800 [Powellomyces hirtus]|uniref:P-loop containing nucleoside triphosphate hydrolase protein n=1 Tax=Powellomyces hirtus TaxID=109895 RepID=A0A507DU26_9FUNG|nr:hypothetical protein PhCBS80983_g05800 [Powellomyces hirtus]